MKIRALLMVAVWFAQSMVLCRCSSTQVLPEPIQRSYDTDKIFKITWFEKPFADYSMYLVLYANGSIGRMLVSRQGEKGVFPEQLTTEQREEIQALLAILAHNSSQDPSGGSKVITSSFLWQGKHHILSFNESSCPDELEHLFEVVNETRESEHQLSFPSPCNSERSSQASEPPLSDSIPFELPDFVREIHHARLFHITWFEQPFTDSYKELSVFVDHYMGENVVTCWETDQNTAYGELTEAEKQETWTILETLTSANSTRLPAEGMVITLGFSWEGDYHLLSFGEADCPPELQRLFEIGDTAYKRLAPEYDLFQIPCHFSFRYGSGR